MQMYAHHRRIGFTLVEVLIVGALMSLFLGITTQSLFQGARTTSLTERTNQVVRDLREMQVRAMNGETSQSGASLDWSVRFDTDRYTLYPGTIYDRTNAENQVVLLEPTMQFTSITFPGNTVTFARGSGDVRSYAQGADTVLLSDTDAHITTLLKVNRSGVVFVTRQ